MRKLLIANRGEIAVRVAATARRMGVATVAVFSEADADAPHVRVCDQAVAIGPAPAAESYLNQAKLLDAARATGADAIHPGYGFLSENADFADAVRAAGLVFVGPSGEAMRAMGLKDRAKSAMKSAGVPVTPGYQGADQSLPRLERAAAAAGFPLLIKAVAGGGGKGMRVVESRAEFAQALFAAQREAQAAFGDSAVLLERYIRRARHVEVQIFGDTHGNVVHLHERDCSLQRRHQKVLEEAPAPGLSDALRHTLGIAAVTAGHAIAYQGAGTVEFILDLDDTDANGDPKFYFMEMNTRLQVEHPVTELVTGLDLVEWQIRVARGEMLPLSQDAIEVRGHAVEARLYAENPATGFLPSTGRLSRLSFPEGAGIRVDSGVAEGGAISAYYDPMIAKVIGHGRTRAEAIDALVSALAATRVEGVHTNRGFLARLADHPDFRAGHVDTGFIPARADSLLADPPVDPALVAVAAALIADAPATGSGPFARPFRINLPVATAVDLWSTEGERSAARVSRDNDAFAVDLGGTTHRVALRRPLDPLDARVDAEVDGARRRVVVEIGARDVEVREGASTIRLARSAPPRAASAGSADGRIAAPMPGRVLAVDVRAGDRVEAGQRLLVLEAMKMEHRLVAPFAGTVESVAVRADAQVAEGAPLVTLTPAG